jgi:HSP20 family molecular chaperone IbpA
MCRGGRALDAFRTRLHIAMTGEQSPEGVLQKWAPITEVPRETLFRASLEGYAFVTTRPSPFGHPFLLGFDEIEQALDRVSKAANDGYPPYNIERLTRTEHQPERLRITLAVAGFTRDQLDVMLEESQLVVRGRQVDDKTRQFLHRGIAARQFQRAFLLADGMEVMGADLSNGLLSIDLTRPEPDRIVRKIAIASRDED